MTDSLQPDLQKFLFDVVENVEDLLILGWLRRLGASSVVSVSDIATVTGIQGLSVEEALERLAAKKVLEKKPGDPARFRYAPPDPEFSGVLDLVIERYDVNSMDILRVLSANSIERLRRAALRTLAESENSRGPKRD